MAFAQDKDLQSPSSFAYSSSVCMNEIPSSICLLLVFESIESLIILYRFLSLSFFLIKLMLSAGDFVTCVTHTSSCGMELIL